MTTLVKLEKNLCRCCHEEGYFVNLALPFKYQDEENTYSELLTFCFDIHVSPVKEAVTDITFTICNNCIEDLRNAYRFKKQVMFCEERFNQMLGTGDIMHVDEMNVPVKYEEKSDSDLDSNIGYSEHESHDEDSNLNTFLIATDSKNEIVQTNTQGPFLKMKILPKRVTTKKVVTKKRITKKALTKKTVQKKQNDKNTKESHSTAGHENTSKTQAKTIKPQIWMRANIDYVKEAEDVYTCGHCDRTPLKWHTLKKHVKRDHYNIPLYYCALCPETFRSIGVFARHKYDVHGIDERFQCDLCLEIFYDKCSLKNHRRNHHKLGEKFKCDQCPYVSYTESCVRRHTKRCHTSMREFQCSYCAKAFKTRTHLNYHERIHTGDKRKICKICSQAFVQKASLNYHMAKCHPGTPF